MDSAHLEFRESVLSTRSLSYISHAGSMGSPTMNRSGTSYFRAAYHNNNMTPSDMSEDEHLEMKVPQQEHAGLNDIPELPDSVAHSLLFELPREIRDRIYALCLTAIDGLPLEWPRPEAPGYGLQSQLLRTCRIVHDECAPLLYTLNNFTFHHPSDANMFVRAFAASPMYGRQITNLSLHIKAQDMRIWMGYLTSADESRSLKADYPNLKELGVRFRSNKWKHEVPPEANLKVWSEDNRLEELMDGLRHVFTSGNSPDRLHISERELQAYLARNPSVAPNEEDTSRFRKRLLELQKLRAGHGAGYRQEAPTIRVCCACRVHATHFNAITNPSAARRDSEDPPKAVVEGEPFRGFTAVDLQHGVRRLIDPDLGSANVARTFYTDKQGVMLALEIHCLDPKRDAGERAS